MRYQWKAELLANGLLSKIKYERGVEAAIHKVMSANSNQGSGRVAGALPFVGVTGE